MGRIDGFGLEMMVLGSGRRILCYLVLMDEVQKGLQQAKYDADYALILFDCLRQNSTPSTQPLCIPRNAF